MNKIKSIFFILLFYISIIFIGCNATLQSGLNSLPLLDNSETRSISAENMTGEKGEGGMAIPDPLESKQAASARAADDLGQGNN
jgi:hypothetical protein